MTTITAYTDLRSPYTFVAKAEAYRWEEDFGVVVDWWPYTTPLEDAFGPAEGRDERQLRKIKYAYMNVRRLGAAQGLTIRGTKRDLRPHARPRRAVAGQGRRRLPRLPRPRVRAGLPPRARPGRSGPRPARRWPRRAATSTPGPGAFGTAPRSWKRSIAAPRRRGSSGCRASSSTASSSGERIRWRRSGKSWRSAPPDARSPPCPLRCAEPSRPRQQRRAGRFIARRSRPLGPRLDSGWDVSSHAGRALTTFASAAGEAFHLTLVTGPPSPRAGGGAGSIRCTRSAVRCP